MSGLFDAIYPQASSNLRKGLAKGLGAGFKLKEKDREKYKEKEKEREREPMERKLSSRWLHDQEKEEDAEHHRPRSRHRSARHHSHRRSNEFDSPSHHESGSQDRHFMPHHPYGWTSMLEDWYCHNHAQDGNSQTASQDGHEPFYTDSGGTLSPKAKSTGDLNARLNVFRESPYELVVKERMMGIYVAIFVHRDIKDLVESAWYVSSGPHCSTHM